MGSMSNMPPAHYSVFRSPEPAYHVSDMHSSQKHRHHGHESSYPATYVLPHPASTALDGRVTVPASATTLTATTPAIEDRFYSGRRPGSVSGSAYRSLHSLNSSAGPPSDGGLNHHGHVGIHYAAESNHHHHSTLPTLQNTQSSHFPTMVAHSTGHSPELAHSHHMGYPPNYLSSQGQYGNGMYSVDCNVQSQNNGQHPSNLYQTTSNNVSYDAYSRSNGVGHPLPSLGATPLADSTGYSAQRGLGGLDGQHPMRVMGARPKPQCWEHGCNGRQFSTFSNLLRHQREKSGTAAKSSCPRCGAVFTRTTARNGHVDNEKCKPRKMNESD